MCFTDLTRQWTISDKRVDWVELRDSALFRIQTRDGTWSSCSVVGAEVLHRCLRSTSSRKQNFTVSCQTDQVVDIQWALIGVSPTRKSNCSERGATCQWLLNTSQAFKRCNGRRNCSFSLQIPTKRPIRCNTQQRDNFIHVVYNCVRFGKRRHRFHDLSVSKFVPFYCINNNSFYCW